MCFVEILPLLRDRGVDGRFENFDVLLAGRGVAVYFTREIFGVEGDIGEVGDLVIWRIVEAVKKLVIAMRPENGLRTKDL